MPVPVIKKQPTIRTSMVDLKKQIDKPNLDKFKRNYGKKLTVNTMPYILK